MYTEMALTARRFALTLAVAGIAAMGSVALAPAASAAPVEQDGPGTIIETTNGNGPDQFLSGSTAARRSSSATRTSPTTTRTSAST